MSKKKKAILKTDSLITRLKTAQLLLETRFLVISIPKSFGDKPHPFFKIIMPERI